MDPDQKPSDNAAPASRHARDELVAGKYRLVKRLGEGGMGEVWVALNEQLDAQVALKLVTRAGASEELVARFEREARAAARLNHPAIVRVFDFGETESGELFMVMELLRGDSLERQLKAHAQIPAVEAVRLLLPIADALATAHARGVVHRDVKPDNILLAENAAGRVEPKLLDFGISMVTAEAELKRITQRGMIVGTPDYLSPEQALAQDDVTPLTDVWSFCVVLYEAIAGRRPFVGAGHMQVLSAILQEAPRPLTEDELGDAELWKILERGLQKDPDLRFEGVREMGTELARWLLKQGVSSDATGASLIERWPNAAPPAATPAPGADDEEDAPVFALASARPGAPVIAARVLLLLLLGVIGFITVRWLR